MNDPFSPTRLPHFHPTHLVVHYNEVALKGRNRGRFEEQLVSNIRAALAGLGKTSVRRLFGRISVRLESDDISWPAAAKVVSRVFGIAYLFPAMQLEPDLDLLSRAAVEAVAGDLPPYTFGVACKRANKELPFTSMEVQEVLGGRLREATGWPVELDHPQIAVRVEIINKAAFLGFGRIDGPGGMPTRVAGRVVCLLSGGIDSPVAAHRLMRRGATPTFVHFHSYPHTGVESQEKVRELAELILPRGLSADLYSVPFATLQRKIVAHAPAPLRVLLYRRFMLRVAEAIARRLDARALVTGESLGQVASQTLENLDSIDAVATIPVLRPLIGMDKVEIVAAARALGTFQTSIQPHDDCCSFLMPKSPATHSRPRDLDNAEASFDVEEEVKLLLRTAEVARLGGASQSSHEFPAGSRSDSK